MSRTRYKFKGYTITNCGYHQPDHCVWWEAVDENGEACFHGHSLREVEFMILDDEWEKKLREKDAEIERLKHSSVGNAAVMRKALMDIDKAVWHGGRTTQGEKDAHWLATTALTTPPRNCDMFATVKDAAIEFSKLRNNPHPCPDFVFSEWLLAPAAEGGANA